MAQVDEVRLMLQGHQKQLETVHELGGMGKKRSMYYLKSQNKSPPPCLTSPSDLYCYISGKQYPLQRIKLWLENRGFILAQSDHVTCLLIFADFFSEMFNSYIT